jgi:endonuclease-8
MPEGDTIFRAARALGRALAGRRVARFEAVYPALMRVDADTPVAGRTIEAVTSVGKHLLMHFSGGLVLRTHMRMHGAWHLYRPGERWRRPGHAMRIRLDTDEWTTVGFEVPVAEFLAAGDLDRATALTRLGPDLLAPDVDVEAVVGRAAARRDVTVADVLLDQAVAAGLGNVFKSELLFICRVHPETPAETVDLETWRRIYGRAIALLRANVAEPPPGAPVTWRGGRRTTRRDQPSAALYVYGRQGQACRRCGTRIDGKKTGPDARLTCWCPGCQPRRDALAAGSPLA